MEVRQRLGIVWLWIKRIYVLTESWSSSQVLRLMKNRSERKDRNENCGGRLFTFSSVNIRYISEKSSNEREWSDILRPRRGELMESFGEEMIE